MNAPGGSDDRSPPSQGSVPIASRISAVAPFGRSRLQGREGKVEKVLMVGNQPLTSLPFCRCITDQGVRHELGSAPQGPRQGGSPRVKVMGAPAARASRLPS